MDSRLHSVMSEVPAVSRCAPLPAEDDLVKVELVTRVAGGAGRE